MAATPIGWLGRRGPAAAGSVLPVVTAALFAAATAEADEGKSGLPQLNATDFSPQLVWLALSFGVLYLLLARIVLPRIETVIGERRNRVQRDLDEAERLKSETEKALAHYEDAYATARAKANEIAKRTHAELAAKVEAERTRVDQQIASRLAEAEARITETKAKAMTHVNEIAAETAEAIVAKLIGKESAEPRRAAKAGAGE
jgi:F-type H+-transporting ATPase subunit b